jgi:hypothetical protein
LLDHITSHERKSAADLFGGNDASDGIGPELRDIARRKAADCTMSRIENSWLIGYGPLRGMRDASNKKRLSSAFP